MPAMSHLASFTADERRAGISLAGVFALRMLGLFLILPVFAIHAHEYTGGENRALIGLALGAYGLTQALLHIPLGVLSDRIGRKPVIVGGLLVFFVGSVLAALASDIHTVIAARAIQGAGAISAAVTALAADLTRETHRTRIMAMIGSSIALMFALSMVAAPTLHALFGMAGIFWITAALALVACVVVWKIVPEAPARTRSSAGAQWRQVWQNGQLLRLNFGVFCLHLIQMSMWVLVPAALVASGLESAALWQVYLPAVLLSFLVMVPAVIVAETRGQMKSTLCACIALIVIVQGGLHGLGHSAAWLTLWLTLFFAAFNVLEAILPSWISRAAPADAKGFALGLYGALQSCGLFLGGAAGGLLARHFGAGAVYLACALCGLLWLFLASGLHPPARPAAKTV